MWSNLVTMPSPWAGVGATSLRAIRITLGKALGDVVRKGLLYRNPVELADRPKAQKRDATVIVWTPKEDGVFMRSVTGDRLAACGVQRP